MKRNGDRPSAADAARSRRLQGLDLHLAGALAFVLALNLPLLSQRVVPIHDTFYNLANFHIFYGELLAHGDLARWYPYGTFGLQSDFEQAASLSPASYAVGLAGALLGVRDVLLLFKLGALVEQVALVLGMHLLGRRLFRSPATTFVLCLAAAGSAVWTGQQWWDFRLYYLLPLLLAFFASFLATERPQYLWLAGLTGVAWALGLPPYATPLLAFVATVVGVVAMGPDLPRLLSRLLTPSRANLLAFGAFAGLAGAYAWFVSHALDHTTLHAPGRDELTGKVLPETFRTYAGNANLLVVARALWFGWPLQLPWGNGADNSVYVGLLPLLALALAVVSERSRFFLGVMAAAAALVLLSLGGAFTRLAYHLPGFAYYRHVALVYGLVKVLLLVAAGFGLERLWSLGPPRFALPLLLLCTGALILRCGYAFLPFGPGEWILDGRAHVIARLAAYGALLVASRTLALPPRHALALGLVLDLSLFQLAFYELRIPKLPNERARLLQALTAREPAYRPIRLDPPSGATPLPWGDAAQAGALAFALTERQQSVGPGIKEVYWYVYQFAQLDPCRSRYRTDYLPEGVDRLLRVQRESGGDASRILGCGAPKLRLVPEVRFARSADEAETLVAAALSGREPTTVVRGPEEAASPAAGGGGPTGRVEVTGFTLGELRAEVHVVAPGGAWLVYADAYHPGWRAEVNGRSVTVYEADLAFKAVPVPSGASTVRLWFDHGANTLLGLLLAAFGAASALGLLLAAGFALVRTRAPAGGVAGAGPPVR